MLNMIKGVIFDMDGTIILSEKLHFAAYSEVLSRFGIFFKFEDYMRRFAGSGSHNIFSTVLMENGKNLTEAELNEIIEEKRDLYTKIVQLEEVPLVAGIRECLMGFQKKGMPMAIATGNGKLKIVRFMLKRAGIESFFSHIVSIAEVPNGKPAPDVFLEAARRLKTKPNETLVFEDAVNGVVAAHSAGMRVIALETTTPREELIAAGADKTIKDYYGISDL